MHLPPDEYFLTAALPAAQSVLACIDIRSAAHYLDMVNLMAYDFCGHWTHRSGHHSQLYAMNKDETSGSSGVAFLVGAGCPAKKINLGIPLYGRSFLGVSGPGHRFKGVGGEEGTFDFNQLPRKGTKEQVDKRIGAAMCVGGDGGFVSYDNPDTVKMKASYCKQKGLGVSVLLKPDLLTHGIAADHSCFRGSSIGADLQTHARRHGALSRPVSRHCTAPRGQLSFCFFSFGLMFYTLAAFTSGVQ